jgi:hypothetical protein
MPDVPNLPGVPALASYSLDPPALLFADTALVVSRSLQPQWGIYTQAGAKVVASSLASLLGLGSLVSAVNSIGSILTGGAVNVQNQFSVVDFEYKQDWTVSDYPVEQGGFQSYDKVQLPFDVKMRIAAGGSASNRQALLGTIDGIANAITLYDVYTPEQAYIGCNVTHYDYKRAAANGAGMILIDVWLVEVRVTATAAFQNTQQPGVAGQQALGNVSAGPPGVMSVGKTAITPAIPFAIGPFQ